MRKHPGRDRAAADQGLCGENVVKKGDKYGEWTLQGVKTPSGKSVLELCLCSCGTKRYVKRCVLRTGASRSCGCKKAEYRSTHGMHGTATYTAWQQAKKRCTDKKDKDYPNYGGRGITFDCKWDNFEAFYADMGDKPEGLTLGRIDNDKGYTKRNCKWETWLRQARNKRNTRWLTCDGQKLCIQDWADKYGVTALCIRARLRAGWSVDEAIKTQTSRRRRTL